MMKTMVTMMAFLVKLVLALLTTRGGGPSVKELVKSSCFLLYKANNTFPYSTESIGSCSTYYVISFKRGSTHHKMQSWAMCTVDWKWIQHSWTSLFWSSLTWSSIRASICLLSTLPEKTKRFYASVFKVILLQLLARMKDLLGNETYLKIRPSLAKSEWIRVSSHQKLPHFGLIEPLMMQWSANGQEAFIRNKDEVVNRDENRGPIYGLAMPTLANDEINHRIANHKHNRLYNVDCSHNADDGIN